MSTFLAVQLPVFAWIFLVSLGIILGLFSLWKGALGLGHLLNSRFKWLGVTICFVIGLSGSSAIQMADAPSGGMATGQCIGGGVIALMFTAFLWNFSTLYYRMYCTDEFEGCD